MLEWQREFKTKRTMSISVNISARQFNAGLPAFVDRVLKETGLDPAFLKLEITESVIMDNPEVASALIFRLKEMGVQIMIDDFGTGYSSLNYIHKFPVNALKIDRTFVQNLHNDRDAQEIVKAITHLAHNLNMNVIVEGVEMLDQLEYFRKLNCNFSQGFLFSEPLTEKDVQKYMRQFQD